MRKKAFGLSLFVWLAACGAPAGGGSDGSLPEKTASGAAALGSIGNLGVIPHRVNCQVTTASPVHAIRQPDGRYAHSVWSLFDELQNGCTASSQSACDEQLAYTSAIYSQIAGAAGYYYVVLDSIQRTPWARLEWAEWIAIPIADASSPSFYSSPPLPKDVRTPITLVPDHFGTPVFDNVFDLSDGDAPYYRLDHTNLWNIRYSNLNTDAVGGRVKPDSCVMILDESDQFLDFSAELEEHDPNGCANCRQ
jgi:hypothetical protein